MRALAGTSCPPTLVGEDAYVRAVVAASPGAIVAVDREGTVTLWNPAAQAAFGWSTAEAVGTEVQPELGALCTRVLAGEEVSALPVTLQRRDGVATLLRVSAVPLRDGAGEAYGVAAFFTS
jgi:PAS domain S-box-containing protein